MYFIFQLRWWVRSFQNWIGLQTGWQVWDGWLWRFARSTVLNITAQVTNFNTDTLPHTKAAGIACHHVHCLFFSFLTEWRNKSTHWFCSHPCLIYAYGICLRLTPQQVTEMGRQIGSKWHEQACIVWMKESWVTAQHVFLCVNDVLYFLKVTLTKA